MNWNKERLIEKYMDNPTSLNYKAGITLPPPSPPALTASSSGSRQKSFVAPKRTTRRSTAAADSASKSKLAAPDSPTSTEPAVCQICFDDTQTDMSALSCDHKFCTDCWTLFLHSKIRGEGESTIRCMAADCELVAPDSFIKKLLEDDLDTYRSEERV